ncbi:tRNA 4-thiouridine(8) synthase ThiI [Patescibacteria group bacterium]|nr:tRNA 4-thiouridine(8) synthase ThiI [Patescibacteria group bacterium]
MKKGVLIAYGELFLKSEGVRKLFLQRLENNIKFFLNKEKIDFKFYGYRERMFVETDDIKKTFKVLKNIFGIAWYSEVLQFPDLKSFLFFDFQGQIKEGDTFAIRMKKDRKIIDQVAKLINRKVNLDNPKKELFIEQRKEGFFLYFKKIKGAGGLPAGSSGKFLSMVSGGIDSVPAGYLAVKRGGECLWLHFHSFPLVSNKSIEKVKELAEVFKKYQQNIKIYMVPFQKIQMEIKANAPVHYRVLLYRRLMLKIAEEIAEKEGCEALVTGESIGQVSSQTLRNMKITEEGVKIPVLRPLIGMDKEEIIELANKIGTFDISIKPQEDCCTLFVPKHQTAKGDLKVVKDLEKKLNSAKLVKEILKSKDLTIVYA